MCKWLKLFSLVCEFFLLLNYNCVRNDRLKFTNYTLKKILITVEKHKKRQKLPRANSASVD